MYGFALTRFTLWSVSVKIYGLSLGHASGGGGQG